jgi:hypothetical protein
VEDFVSLDVVLFSWLQGLQYCCSSRSINGKDFSSYTPIIFIYFLLTISSITSTLSCSGSAVISLVFSHIYSFIPWISPIASILTITRCISTPHINVKKHHLIWPFTTHFLIVTSQTNVNFM